MGNKEWFCGSCKARLGKGSKKSPSLWCHICGWVHFKCSGIRDSKEYHANFLCSNCKENRVLFSDEVDKDYAAAFTNIHEHYTNARKKSAFGSRQSLIKEGKFRAKDVDRYLNSSETYTKFKLTPKRFPRLKVVSYRLNEIWSIDLADMQQLANSNAGIRYLFVAVDVLSRYLWVEAIKSKTAKACTEALKKIIANNEKSPKPKICRETHRPEKIWVDKGREFAGEFASYCHQNGIEIYSTKSETKSALAERNIRSLKSLIFKYMHEHDQNRYCDVLDHFVAIINNRVNRMTKLAPASVSQKDVKYLVSLCHTNLQRKPKFKVGDCVRVRRKIDTFHRGYRIQFTEELFTITAIPTNNPPTYVVKDSDNEIIQGKFYEPELVRFVPPPPPPI